MKKFSTIKYERINYEQTKIKILDLISKLKIVNSFKEFLYIFKQIIEIQNHIEEMYDYVDINNMRNLDNKFYEEELLYLNDCKPKLDNLFLEFYQIVYYSKYHDELSKYVPKNFFNIIFSLIGSKEDISLLEQVENKLKKQYRDLNKSRIYFRNEEFTISKLSSFFKSTDRNLRKQAYDCLNDFYYEHAKEYDEILYNLINVRNKIARKLGFKNYKEYSLVKLKRFDYDYFDISMFRNNVIKYINPVIKKLRQQQQLNLNISKLEYYDTIFYKDSISINCYGNELIMKITDLIKQLDCEFYKFIKNLYKGEYIDLESRDNKVGFSITNYLVETKIPVVTGNFKNNYLDIITFCHEIGHAYQKYCASLKDNEYISPLLKYPTMEIAEMFSYAMELICMDYLQPLFKNNDYEKYKILEIHKLISNLPYICLVDEFQELIYSKEDLKTEDIRKIWNKLVKKYDLEISNSGHVNLDNGGYFYRQTHIYLDPFYYIDYGLSYFGAFAIKDKCINNLEFFKELGSIASYYSFKDLIRLYNLPSPFNEETVKEMCKKI